MKSVTTCGRQGLIWAGLAILAAGVATAQSGAWPEMPNHKTFIVPTFFPKNGQTDFKSFVDPALVKTQMENFYEGYWRETSYYRANPTNGLNVRGYFMDTKTGGEVAMPWAWNLAAAPTWANYSSCVGDLADDRFPDGRGEHFDELADKKTPAVLYRRYNAATTNSIDEPLVDGVWTPGERFTDRGGTAEPNGRWDDYIHAEDRWTPVRSNSTISADLSTTNTMLSENLISFINSSVTIGGTNYAKGDFFYDYDSSILTCSTNNPPRVLTFDSGRGMASTNDVIWVADLDRQLNVPVRISEFDLTPILSYNSSPITNSTTVFAEDRWPWSATSRILSNTGHLVLPDPVLAFLSTPDVGDVIADYDFTVYVTNNTFGTRVSSVGSLASSNALFYIANLTSGTNVQYRLNELDLVPPMFFRDLPAGSISTVPAEDYWTPTHSFTGIASLLTDEFLPIKNFLASNTVGDAILDYDFSCYPEYESWNLGVTNITIWIADTLSGTNRPVVVNQLDLTPPRYFQNGIPFYGRKSGGGYGYVTNDPSINLEGDAGHTYNAGSPPGAYTNVARTGRLEVDYVNDPLYGYIPSMNVSSLAVTTRVYFVSAIITACTNAPGTVIRYPDPVDSFNRFVYTNGRVRVIEKDFDFWSACVDQVGTPANAALWSEVSIPLYTASPIWGTPSNRTGPEHYTNTASVAGVLNPFEDATSPSDDVWTPAWETSTSLARTPVYGYVGGDIWTNGPGPGYDGDVAHDYLSVNTNPPYANVGRLGRFEYQVDAAGRPYVYAAGQGITLLSFIPASVVTNCLNNSSSVFNGCRYIPSEDRIVVVDNAAFRLLSRTAPVDRKYPAYVTVPLYYSAPMWGKPVDTVRYTNAMADINNRFEDATIPKDDQPTPGTNYVLSISGGILVPNYGVGVTNNTLMEGDAAWTYVRDNKDTPPNMRPQYGDVDFLNRLEYNVGVGGQPYVYQSPRQYDVEISTYVNLQTTFYDNLLLNAGVEMGGYVFTNTRVRVVNSPLNFLGTARRNDSFYVATDEMKSDAGVTRVLVTYSVSLYYSIALWGAPHSAVNFTNPPSATIGIGNPFNDAIGADDKPTAAVAAETFSDFISWWDPTGGRLRTGIWVPGLVDVPTNGLLSVGVLPRGSTPTEDYWSYNRYIQYIANNYPGDVAGLIARCGDNTYDGPETWVEAGNNQMIQQGFRTGRTGTSSPKPSQSQWDFNVGPPNIQTYDDWWMNRYGRYGSSHSKFEIRIPSMNAWGPVSDANQVCPTTTQTVNEVQVILYGDIIHPPTNSTWTYDSPREFDDLASSMYHNPDLGSLSGQRMRSLSYRTPAPSANPQAVWDGGDMRLGEETCPFGGSIYGMDRGDNNPSSADISGGDGSIPACGPYAYNTHANTGYDAANQLNLEFSTWCTDGGSPTGPRGGHRKTPGYDCNTEIYSSYAESIMYARDHRDVNLNGLIDQGETVPAGSYNYYQDADPVTRDNGMNTMPLFGWERSVEDMVDTLDMTENFEDITTFTLPPGPGDEEWGIITPSGYVWRQGTEAVIPLSILEGADILYADSDASGTFTPHVDALWVDDNGDGKFNDREPIIHGVVSDQSMPSGVGPEQVGLAYCADLNSNNIYDIGVDLLWMNTFPIGESLPFKFNSEPVLCDATGKLKHGDGNAILSAGLRAKDATTGLIRSIYVFPNVTDFTLMWAVTNAYAGTNEIYYGSPNGVDLIYAKYGTKHPAMTTTGVLWTGPSVRYVCRTQTDTGYQPGDDVFIDTDPDGRYTADRFISGPYGSIPLNSSGQEADFPIRVGYTTNGINTIFQRDTSVAWLEQNSPSYARSRETVLFQSFALTNGTAGIDISSKIQVAPGYAVFYDANTNGIFEFGSTAQIPLYMVGLLNGTGISSPNIFTASQRYGTMTRNGYISGFNQNQSASLNMPNPALLTHEQSHDVLGWPDLYDYDQFTGDPVNTPVGGGDLMANGGGLIHGYPDLKTTYGVQQQGLNFNNGSGQILQRNGGPRTVLMYPVERFADQYYVFRDERNPRERFILNFNAGSLLNTINPNNEQVSPYANSIGRGIVISKSDDDAPQQRGNNRFRWLYVQADGKYELENGRRNVEQADAFGMTPTTRQFTALTKPAAVWFDGADSGLRILDIRIPTDPYAPAQVDIEWVSTTTTTTDPTDWYWVPSGVDSDGDGIPDAWEYYWFGRYPNPLVMVNRSTDFDGDGLTDYEEWLLHSNPTWQSSWESKVTANPKSDADADIDDDGLSNRDELRVWNTNPRDIDSDDDGITDGAEFNRDIVKPGGRRLTDPAYSRSPLIERALRLEAANAYLLPEQSTNMPYALNPITDFTRLQLTNWTVEAWVWLDTTNERGSVVTRKSIQNSITFALAVSNNHPYASFSTMAGVTNLVMAPDAITASNWVHIAGTYDSGANVLKIYVDGELKQSKTAFYSDLGHPGYIGGGIASADTRLGGGLNGIVDEVRIWSRARTVVEIETGCDKIVNTPSSVLTNGSFTGASIVNDGSLVVNLRFDDAQNLTNRLDSGVVAFGAEDWVHAGNWHYAVRGMLTSQFVTNTTPKLVLTDSLSTPYDDLNEDGIPDWWQRINWPTFDPFVAGPWDAANDADSDGTPNTSEYILDLNPLSDETGLPGDPHMNDLDGDGLSNADEIIFGTDPTNPDTDDDGYWDGDEINVFAPAITDAFGVSAGITGPTDSHSPEVPRSLILGGRNLEAPKSKRFMFMTDTTNITGPTVTITTPVNEAPIAVRFSAIIGSVVSPVPVASVRLYVNDNYMTSLSLDALNRFDYTTIVRSGPNVITVVAVDQEGGIGQATVNVTGTFASADIRVTQTWDNPGDLDTWLVDPIGRHMGFSSGGPGLPVDLGGGYQIPGAVLDIDDTQFTGPENITVQRGSAIAGNYQVWMNNYGNRGSPNSTVRVLVNEGQPNERYVEFGPQAMPVTGGNNHNPAAWWNTTIISLPSGDMSPPGTPVGGVVNPEDPGTGIGADTGWTVEGWVKVGATDQSGALATYRTRANSRELFLVGLSNNCPIMRITVGDSTPNQQYVLIGHPIPTNRWTHIAAVCSESQKSIRLLIDGVLTCALFMPETRLNLEGQLYIDSDLDGLYFDNALVDELRFWNLARNGGLIASQMHTSIYNAQSLVAAFPFDDGGKGIEDSTQALNRGYDLRYRGASVLPDLIRSNLNDFVTNDAAQVFGLRDRDKDDMPDWFEFLFSGSETDMKSLEDTDNDELFNLTEYRCGTSPLDVDTDGDFVLDALQDFDGDGLNNLAEQDAGSDPRYRDTDDDGFTDAWEVAYGSDPADALSPAKMRALQLDGSAEAFVRAPQSERLNLRGFDLSAWVYPTATPPSNGVADIIVREVQTGVYNYRLALDSQRRLFMTFTASDLSTNVTLVAPDLRALPLNTWTHVRGQFDAAAGTLQLIQNGAPVAFVNTSRRPAQNGWGPVNTLMGRGLTGYLDAVLIKGSPETVLDYRFDDDTSDTGTAASGTSGTFGPQAWHHGQVQDFAAANSNIWSVSWRDAGTLVGAAKIIKLGADGWTLITGSLTDTDGDGLPDDWEIANGLNPLSVDTDGDGTLDPDEDFDGDGVSNADEWLLGTDPLIPYAGVVGDGDYTEDWWEDQYAEAVATSLRYDSLWDWDEDGWDNWSEARYEAKSGVITRPDKSLTRPMPEVVSVALHYPGLLRGSVVVLAYSHRAMDGNPDATFVYADPAPYPANYPVTITTNLLALATNALGDVVSTNRIPNNTMNGRLRQGNNWFFAFIDVNGNQQWDTGEPAGLADRFPYDVGWDENKLSFTLSDKPVNGFLRLTLQSLSITVPPPVLVGTGVVVVPPPVSNMVSITGSGLHNVEIGRITWAGTNVIFTRVFSKYIRGPRNWLHEGDILDPNAVGGGNPGLDWDGRIAGTPDIPITTNSIYALRIDNVKSGSYITNYYAGTTLPTPVAVRPIGIEIWNPRPEFTWNMSPSASAFELQILTTNAALEEVVYSSGTNAAPQMRNADGERVWSPPIHWGDIVPALNGGNGALTNAAFRWRVRAFQPRLVTAFSTYPSSISAYSSLETFRVNLSDTVQKRGSINVRVNVASNNVPSNACIRVQAFETGSLNDLPVVQRTRLNVSAFPVTVTLNGLDDQKSYYIAAYMDQSTDNSRASWESWGYYRSINTLSNWHFQPLMVKAAKGAEAPTVRVMICAVDTDQDGISDSYEYKVTGGLVGTPVMQMGVDTVVDKPKTSDLSWLGVLGLTPNSDVDKDGISDKLEADLGLNANSADQLRITGMGGDSKLNWELKSVADAAGGSKQDAAPLMKPVKYVLERTDSLDSPSWERVANVPSAAKTGEFDLVKDMSNRPAGFYRVRVEVTP